MSDVLSTSGIWGVDKTIATNQTIGTTTGIGTIMINNPYNGVIADTNGITIKDAVGTVYSAVNKKSTEKPKTSESPKPKFVPVIKHVSYSEEPGNRNVTVVFDDGDVRVEKPAADDVFDLQVGVALAIAHKMYQTKNGFRREVNKVKEDVWEKKIKKKERKQKAKERDGEVEE